MTYTFKQERKKITLKPGTKWVEAEIIGDFKCPNCGTLMVVVDDRGPYAVCFKCEQYWIGVKEQENDKGKDRKP